MYMMQLHLKQLIFFTKLLTDDAGVMNVGNDKLWIIHECHLLNLILCFNLGYLVALLFYIFYQLKHSYI